MGYDGVIEACERGAPLAKEVLEAESVDVDLKMSPVSAWVRNISSSLELTVVGPDSDIKKELEALLEKARVIYVEADGLTSRSVENSEQVSKLSREGQMEEALKLEADWEAAQRDRAQRFLDFFEETGEKVEALRDSDPSQISG